MALTPMVFFIVMAGYGLEGLCVGKHAKHIRAVLLILLTVLLSLGLSSTRSINSALLLETESVPRLAQSIPENCYVITAFPTVLHATTNIKAVPTRHALDNPETIRNIQDNSGCLYYFHDLFCSRMGPDFRGTDGLCRQMLQDYQYEVEQIFGKQDVKFLLLRISV